MFEDLARSPLALISALTALALLVIVLTAERTGGLDPRRRRVLLASAGTSVLVALALIAIRFVVLRGA